MAAKIHLIIAALLALSTSRVVWDLILVHFKTFASPITAPKLLVLSYVDFDPRRLNPPHTHPRATKILTVLEGELYVGFVTSNISQTNHLFTKILKKVDVFVFPQGLVHFQFNDGHTRVVAIAALRCQNTGTITIANAIFGSKPPISDEALTKAFQVDQKTVDRLQAQF
ncbi:putative germin-like protein 2-1 [Zingiber officinale]|uniref:Cupin type-1 domain-containing protein n=1 Tax=Zingiber officinale TaxID=94328 RepID=A0A8J5FPZ9_ZINOF|nr:putative germin-like protein 2-1 [Zingiber officinale]KAG6491939.1 hypothetical protein ZIOFF_046880 [Zingiber officinale]